MTSMDYCLMTGMVMVAFLFFSGVTATAQAPDGSQVVPDESPFRLACRVANYGKYQDIALEHIREMGLKYVFMSIPAPDEVEGVLARTKALGLEILVVRGDTNLSKEESVSELAEQVKTCVQLGVRYMFLSPKRHDAPKEVVFDRLRRAGDIAAEHDVVIVLETHPDLGTNALTHIETMAAINHPNIRVNFDTGNITFYNHDTSAVTELSECIAHVATVEVKDHSGKYEDWNFPALGEGVVDFPAFFRVLRAHNYSGPVTLEVEGIKGIEWTVEETKEAMEASVAYLNSIEKFE